MLDLNNAAKQSEFAGVIPKNSMVKLRLEIRPPSEEKQSNEHPALFVSNSNSNNHCLDIVFHVIAGTYENNKIYSNLVVVGSEMASAISTRLLRAIVEGARGINQDDTSDVANLARDINNDPWNLDNLEFAAKVGYEKITAGDKYVKNKIQLVLRPGIDTEYQQIMGGGEIITEEPIPEIPTLDNGPGPGSNQTYNPNQNNGNGGGNRNQTYNPNHNNQGQPQNVGRQTYNPTQGQPSQGQGQNGQPNWT